MSDPESFLTGDKDKDASRVTYVIFISLVAVLSFAVAVLYYLATDTEVKEVLHILDTLYALIFFIDFLLRLRHAADRKHYLLHWGWLDLITSIPGYPALRIIRSLLIIRSSRSILRVTPDEIEAQARERLAESVLFMIVYVGLIVVSVGSVLIVMVEDDAIGANITTGSDAIWWALVTVSTVGYGDQFPVTAVGRIIGTFMIIVGVGLFTSLTSYLASSFTDRGARAQRQQQIDLAVSNAKHMNDVLERIYSLEQQIAEKDGIEEQVKKAEDGDAET